MQCTQDLFDPDSAIKAQLKEFDTYKKRRVLKNFDAQVLDAGFTNCWANKDCLTIITVAEKLPEDTLAQNPRLELYYDLAVTRERY